MDNVEIICDNISKSFSGKKVFENLNLSISSSHSLCITGKNGSGKSTLIKILCGLIRPSKGNLIVTEKGELVKPELRYLKTGLVSPYLNLYDELTARENLEFFAGLKLKANGNLSDLVDAAFEKVGLKDKKNVPVKNYSSGMKQRLKFAFATIDEPEILLLDEPRTNLDSAGIDLLHRICEEQKPNGILIIATNDPDDNMLCECDLNIEDF